MGIIHLDIHVDIGVKELQLGRMNPFRQVYMYWIGPSFSLPIVLSSLRENADSDLLRIQVQGTG
jgi:hypothetical protein